MEALRRNPEVAYIQPNLIHQQPSGSAGIETVQPNVPWHLDRIDQRNLPLNSQYNYTNVGTGVHAYIIDSGIRSTQVEFEGRVVKDFTSINDGNGTEDCANHGTFVASEVGGKTYGVAKKVTLHAVRILTCGNSGTTAQIVAGLDCVAANHLNPNVANMSIQSSNGATDTAMDQAAAGMVDAGVNMVLIAGNFNNSNCTNSPKDPRALITAATTSSDSRNTGSNPSSYGSCVDIWAPGAGLTGAGRASDTAVLTNWSGTSMAAPLVTGTIAMALQSHPNLTMQQAYNLIVNNATTGVLQTSATHRTGCSTRPGWIRASRRHHLPRVRPRRHRRRPARHRLLEVPAMRPKMARSVAARRLPAPTRDSPAPGTAPISTPPADR